MAMCDQNNISVYYQNTRGLRTKTSIFFRNICLHDYDVILLTETWLTEGINNSELFNDRYTVWRQDRDYSATKQKLGGGVLIATRKGLTVMPQPTFHSTAEDLWVTITLKDEANKSHLSLHICVVYMCQMNLVYSFSHQLSSFFDNTEIIMNRHPDDKFLIIGDFNLSKIIWKSVIGDSYLVPNNYQSADECLLVDMLNLLNLRQYNSIPNSFGRTLDLVLANDNLVTVADSATDPLVPVDSHHGALSLHINVSTYKALNHLRSFRFMFQQADYDLINDKISEIDWVGEFSGRTLDDCVEYFYDRFYYLRDEFIPRKPTRVDNYPKWYTLALKKALKEKHKYLRKFKLYGNQSDLISFQFQRDRVRRLEKSCYFKYIHLVEKSIGINPGYFWSYVNTKSRSKGMPNCLKYNNTLFNTGSSICEAFSKHFQSSFLDSGNNAQNNSSSSGAEAPLFSPYSSDISTVYVDENLVFNLLNKLDPNKPAGPDHMPSYFLLRCAKSISKPISIIFKRSLEEGVVPVAWKKAFVTPVHKKGPKNEIVNYRPISKLCIVSKVFERLVYDQVYPALKQSFSSSQHGFLKNRSTVSNLILLNEFTTDAMDMGAQVDVVYTDYSKAFDRIKHDLLLHKLSKIGIKGNLLRWFSSYILNRSQAVVINNYVSGWIRIPSGVPQGSLLGPLLFVIFVNDIDECFRTSQLLCFADDMKIISTITSYEDALALQADLVRLEEYCITNHLDLNPSKCTIVTFTRSNRPILFNYSLKGINLQRSSVVRDLGVIHDSKLLFNTHVDDIVSRAYKALGFVMRSSADFTDVKTLKILYCTYVRSKLEYASQIWSPAYATYILRIEALQKKFMRFICHRLKEHYCSDKYFDLCRKHHLLPLADRREIADLVYLFKIASGTIDCPSLLSRVSLRVPTRHLRQSELLHLPSVSRNYKQNAFLWRVSKNFNNLIRSGVDVDLFCTSVESVRRLLSNVFFSGTE